jgi:hypothetical protein
MPKSGRRVRKTLELKNIFWKSTGNLFVKFLTEQSMKYCGTGEPTGFI